MIITKLNEGEHFLLTGPGDSVVAVISSCGIPLARAMKAISKQLATLSNDIFAFTGGRIEASRQVGSHFSA